MILPHTLFGVQKRSITGIWLSHKLPRIALLDDVAVLHHQHARKVSVSPTSCVTHNNVGFAQ